MTDLTADRIDLAADSDDTPAPNFLARFISYIPPIAYVGRCLDEERYLPVVIIALFVLAAIAVSITQWGPGVIGIVAEIMTALAGLIILSLTF